MATRTTENGNVAGGGEYACEREREKGKQHRKDQRWDLLEACGTHQAFASVLVCGRERPKRQCRGTPVVDTHFKMQTQLNILVATPLFGISLSEMIHKEKQNVYCAMTLC